MGFLMRLFGRCPDDWEEYMLRLAVLGPGGETEHRVVKFMAESAAKAIETARCRAERYHVLRWRLLETRTSREVAWGWPPAPGASTLRQERTRPLL